MFQVTNGINLSATYLRDKFPAITDPYKAAIVGYTLAMNGQSGLVNAVRKIEQLAKAEGESVDHEVHVLIVN